MSAVPKCIYHIVPTYQRLTFAAPHALTDLQADILLLCGAPHTLTAILTALECIHDQKHLYSAIWAELLTLQRLGLLKAFPPDIQQASKPLPRKPSNYPQPYGKYALHGQYAKVA